jgi:hypothetical protein
VSSTIVVIGPADAIPALRERLDSGGAEMHAFTDAEALEALDHIITHKPRIVALDHEFSSTSRGTALINRIKDDPSLVACEVRVIAHDSALNRVAIRRTPSGTSTAIAVDEPKPALDQRGTRRAPRLRIRQGVEVLIDGNPATLVDLSKVGAQVLSPKMLKPNQRVRVAMSDGKGTVRAQASIAWASFEMPKGQPTRYRAGVDFTTTDPEAVQGFAERHKQS